MPRPPLFEKGRVAGRGRGGCLGEKGSSLGISPVKFHCWHNSLHTFGQHLRMKSSSERISQLQFASNWVNGKSSRMGEGTGTGGGAGEVLLASLCQLHYGNPNAANKRLMSCPAVIKR